MDVRLGNNYENYVNPYIIAEEKNSNTDEKKDDIDISKTEDTETYSKKDLDKSINKLNKFLEDENTHAEYSKHKDLGTIMVKIVDENDKVIMELPPEKVLDMVASLCKQVGIIDEKA